MDKQFFCSTFDNLFNEKWLVPLLYDFWIENYVLLKLSFDPSKRYGNWSYPYMIDSIVVQKKEADVIMTICKNHKSFKTSFYEGRDFDVPLSEFDIECIDDKDMIKAFRTIYGARYKSSHVYDWLRGGCIKCYRMLIEKSINSETDYDSEDDGLQLWRLQIVDNQVTVDPSQKYTIGGDNYFGPSDD